MEMNIQLKSLADKINQLKGKIETEESTKHAFVLPFIHVLGYDAFNPLEVVPEFTADLGLKKRRKSRLCYFSKWRTHYNCRMQKLERKTYRS